MFKKIIICFFFLPTILFAANFVEGKDYHVIPGTKAEQSSASVIEFFSYGCPWCYRLEAPLEKWLKTKKQANFQRVPVVFNKDWEIYAKAFYTAKALSMTEKMSKAIFQAIQLDKQRLNTNAEMTAFFVKHGVDKSIAESAFDNSTSIDFAIKNARNQMIQYQINAVPAFVVKGHYKTDLAMAKSPKRLLEILDYLLQK
jgi:thiol:disulfide interchange protein DsbA